MDLTSVQFAQPCMGEGKNENISPTTKKTTVMKVIYDIPLSEFPFSKEAEAYAKQLTDEEFDLVENAIADNDVEMYAEDVDFIFRDLTFVENTIGRKLTDKR